MESIVWLHSKGTKSKQTNKVKLQRIFEALKKNYPKLYSTRLFISILKERKKKKCLGTKNKLILINEIFFQ